MATTRSALPVILVKFVHPWNAPAPSLSTSFPIVTPVISVRPANALGSTSRFPVISISNDLLPHSFEMAKTRSTLPVILVNETQPSKTLLPNCATLSGIVMLVSPVHSAKARSPICTPSGIVMFLSPVHSAKAAKPILIMLSGIMIFINSVQPPNAAFPMLITLPSVGITLVLHPNTISLLFLSIIQLFILINCGLFSSTVMFDKPVQYAKAAYPILVILS